MTRTSPKPGQESVWDYPRPPRAEPCSNRVRVEFNGETIADTTRAWRLLETSHPPVYYIPREDVRTEFLQASAKRTFCEFKGEAGYWDLQVGARISRDAAWSYKSPAQPYDALRDHLAFYPSRVDACLVDDERVQPQTGDFYGGWITSNLVGPFKGGPGTSHW
jgi:uncharacterized protein (DUF427 family)